LIRAWLPSTGNLFQYSKDLDVYYPERKSFAIVGYHWVLTLCTHLSASAKAAGTDGDGMN